MNLTQEDTTNDIACNTDKKIFIVTDENVANNSNEVISFITTQLVDTRNMIWTDISKSIVIPEDGSETLTTMILSHADIVTCSTKEIQEEIFMLTGVLAIVLEKPEKYLEYLEPDSFTGISKILWFGCREDSVGIKRGCSVIFKTNPNWNSIKFDRYDIVYLPPTFTKDGELRRVEKIKHCIRLGKFVVAVEAPVKYCFKRSLECAISELSANHGLQKREIKKHQKLLQNIADTDFQLHLLKEQIKTCQKKRQSI